MEFLISLHQLDTLCTRNEEPKENLSSTDSLLVTTPANLTPELNLSWESQQQLIGDQTSLEYILSCSNRLINKQDEVQSILTRTTRIAKVDRNIIDFICINKISFFFRRFHLNYMNSIQTKKNV